MSILSAECFVSVCILYGWGAGHIFHAYRCWLCVWGVCVCVWLARELVINWSDPMARPGTMAAWAQCAGPSSPPSPSSVPESLRYIQVQLQGPRPSLIIILGSRSSLSHRLKFWTFCSWAYAEICLQVSLTFFTMFQ